MQKREKYRDTGLLILRIGFGIMFMMHGFPKLAGGSESWEKLGGSMANLGITFAPAFWGFMSASTEFIGGVFLILGLFVRPVAVLMVINLIVAAIFHLSKDPHIMAAASPIEDAIVFFSLIFLGPGRYSLVGLLQAQK